MIMIEIGPSEKPFTVYAKSTSVSREEYFVSTESVHRPIKTLRSQGES
jgi:hypothetical protein